MKTTTGFSPTSSRTATSSTESPSIRRLATTTRTNRRIATTADRSRTTSTSASGWPARKRRGARRSFRDSSIASATGPTSSSSAWIRRRKASSRPPAVRVSQALDVCRGVVPGVRQGSGAGTPRWRIPFTHHPPFSAGPQHHNTKEMVRLIPLFERSGVKVVFSGHEHNFQHSRTDGIDYFVSGAAGKVRNRRAEPVRRGAHAVVELAVPFPAGAHRERPDAGAGYRRVARAGGSTRGYRTVDAGRPACGWPDDGKPLKLLQFHLPCVSSPSWRIRAIMARAKRVCSSSDAPLAASASTS